MQSQASVGSSARWPELGHPKTHSRAPVVTHAVTHADRTVWKELEAQAGVDVLAGYSANLTAQPGAAVASPEGSILPTVKDVPSENRVVLYRDTNGWCPFCSKVWMALADKGVAFDTVLIDLFNKPEWYEEVATNNQTPAVRLDGEYLCESLTILLALEEAFPESPLLPQDPQAAAAVKGFCNWVDSTPSPLTKVFTKDFDSAAEAEVTGFLDKIEATKNQLFGELSGPYLFGEFSIADIMVAPFLPVIMESSRTSVNLDQHPHVKKAMVALKERECYRTAATDAWTMWRLQSFFSGAEKVPAVDVSLFSERDMRDRREAAAKLTVRRTALVSRLAQKSGVIHKPGSMYGICYTDVNGRMMNPYESRVEAVVEAAIQRVCVMLLSGDSGNSPRDCEATAIQAAAIAYLRNVGGSPRDMSSGAMAQLRSACDTMLQRLYEFPEPARMEAIQERLRERRDERSAREAVASEAVGAAHAEHAAAKAEEAAAQAA